VYVVITKGVPFHVRDVTDDGDNSPTEVRVNIRTTEEKRSRWKAYADENDDVSHVTQLIHRGVSEYISRRENGVTAAHGGQANDGGSLDDETVDRLTDALSTVEKFDRQFDEILTAVDQLDDRLTTVESHVTPDDDAELDVSTVVASLPHARPESDAWDVSVGGFGPHTNGDGEVRPLVAWDGTIEAVADYHDADEGRIEQMLDYASESGGPVETGVVDGETRYWAPDHSTVIERLGGYV